MSAAISSPPEAGHSSQSRAPSYALPSRSQSTRSRPPTSSVPATAPPPPRAASQHNSRLGSSSSARPAHDILPHEEYANETTNVAAARHHSKRSSSKDRPPSASRTDPAPQPQRRTSQRSGSRNGGQPDMTTVVNNAGPAPVPDSRSAAASSAATAKHGRSRTMIPTQSGKWTLGKTIGAGSMGKVKLAKKEDSTEQVRDYYLCGFRLCLTTLLSRLHARSSPDYPPTTDNTVEPNETGPITLRKYGLRVRLQLLPSSATPISAA